MYFPLDASTNVTFGGSRYLHAFLGQSFKYAPPPKINLNARARQFSSFILLVGRINSASTFEPKTGIIIKDKDDLKMPLDLETIPTPKGFYLLNIISYYPLILFFFSHRI